MAWIAALIGVAANYALNPQGGQPGAERAAAAADPFASQRGKYQSQLAGLMSGTFGPTDPSYKFRMDEGMGTLERGLASRGAMDSGLEKTALMKYGQGMASQEYGAQFDRLAALSGVNAGSPGAAGSILGQQSQIQQQGFGQLGNILGQGAVAGYNWLNQPANDPNALPGGQPATYNDPQSSYWGATPTPSWALTPSGRT